MSIAVIDLLDAWGILLSRCWSTTIGGFVSMDLTHAQIPMREISFEILYSWHVIKKHVMDPNHLDYHSDCQYDVPHRIVEYDPSDFPFAQEDCIDTFLPRTDEYKENIAKYQGKDPSSIKILKKDEE
jgi:hypothetical protein